MRIATITLFCNEHFRLDDWVHYYNEYRDDISLHVIVNNGSIEDTELLQSRFPKSLVLYSPTKNMMASYNLALREILKDETIDTIAQIVNDIRLSEGGFKKMYDTLYSDVKYAIISPILLNKDSETIDLYGAHILPSNLNFLHLDSQKKYSDVCEEIIRECTGLPGGIFLAKRSVYEKVGLQDEQINMYADEVDMGIRVAKLGYKLVATAQVKAWHQHVNPIGCITRNPKAAYYMGRNHIYIAKKHCSHKVVLSTILHRIKVAFIHLFSCIRHHKSREEYTYTWFLFKGVYAGITNKMS